MCENCTKNEETIIELQELVKKQTSELNAIKIIKNKTDIEFETLKGEKEILEENNKKSVEKISKLEESIKNNIIIEDTEKNTDTVDENDIVIGGL
ncbi:hypothetical protein KPH14_000848 [Odynerus spinipes]|uniref:Uncharacterized protein n=1 Tax=Odynerus spinipes TaxID=1348599 RepID=A0AAD9RE47_9HYME|nr:hypothetical protein KPH14_000848 [Odynerus spinipes]